MDQQPWGQQGSTGPQPISPENVPQQTGETPPVPRTDADYPFEEPEQAPELWSERSENLYKRSTPFWDRLYDVNDLPREGETYPQDANYWNHPEVLDEDGLMTVESNRPGEKLKKYLGSGVIKKLLIVLGVLAAVAVVLYSTLFQAREISVVGNTSIPAEEIVRLSGLTLGVNTMTIDAEEVARRIEQNRYLRCKLVSVGWNSVTLHVTERVPAVYINHNGMRMTLDNRGWVLEESMTTATGKEDLIYVTGLNVRRCVLGQAIALTGNDQMEAYTRILVELKAMKGLDLVQELDLSRMDRIYLATRDGYYVHLGDDERIHEKLRSMMITREKVIEMGHMGGTIDVTDPEKPTFSPAGLS